MFGKNVAEKGSSLQEVRYEVIGGNKARFKQLLKKIRCERVLSANSWDFTKEEKKKEKTKDGSAVNTRLGEK